MRKFTLLTLVIGAVFFPVLSLFAQTIPAKHWDKTLGGSGLENFSAIIQTADGGYLAGGSSYSGISGDKSQASKGSQDFWIVRLDPAGVKQWDKTIGGSGNDQLLALIQTSDGGYLLGGASSSGIGGDKSQAPIGGHDFWIIKIDANGNKQWDKTLGGSNEDRLFSLQQTADGGYVLGGESLSGISGDKSQASQGGFNDYWVVKLDSNSNKVWDKSFGGSGAETFSVITQTVDGGYFMGGYSDSNISTDKSQASKGGTDFLVIKIDGLGNKQWDKTIGGSSDDELFSLQQTSNGGYILGGSSNSGISGDKSQTSRGTTDFWVVKLDSTGGKIWDKTFGGSSGDFCRSLKETANGEFILGGSSFSPISGEKTKANFASSDFWILKMDANGSKLWDEALGGNDEDMLISLNQTADGGYILGGGSNSGLSGEKSEASRGGDDYWIVKLGPEILGTKKNTIQAELLVSPNPNQGKFRVRLPNLRSRAIEFTLSDLSGRVIMQEELKTMDEKQVEVITLPGLKGLFLLQIKVDGNVYHQKIMIY